MRDLLILGQILNPLSDTKAQWLKEGAILAKKSQVQGSEIYKIVEIGDSEKLLKKLKNKTVSIIDLSDEVIMPPFFDMHFHWVQDDVRQMPKDFLLEWLDKYTFPTEMKFSSVNYAEKKAKFFFNRIIKTGTLGGAVYSSIHEHAIDSAFKHAKGDFVIGNVQMTINSPKKLTQLPKDVQALTEKLAKKYTTKYAVTPRFAIATDPETMKEGGKSAKKHKSFIQTHLSENKDEISFVNSLYKGMKGFEKITSYTDIYKKVGLLTSKTIMGHAIHLDNEEIATLSKTKTALAHCPTSNAPIKELGLGSGLFDFKKIEKNKIRWALASDIGGGPYLSMFDVMRSFVEQNKKAKVSGASFVKALYRSTMSGAEILGLSKKKGNFLKGKELNFITVKSDKKIYELKNAEEVLKKIIMKNAKKRELYDDTVSKVFYQDQFLFQKEELS